ncbi:homing endonuclease associated repeat-containing protein [Enterococcus sp.]|uniref:homing endonuclease associated repeat-containing protein n=1 Tax=Enterococcus sp. TaxID=35783 RepID=UPI00290EF4A9|nr:hypothetical protein [Enterococcus sp.]MDU5334617.1 hypothetical protein [Enterococcus sp.]
MSKTGASERFLIEKLMEFAEEHGRTPTAIEFGYSDSIKKLFGSYKAFLQSQGFAERIGENELAEKLHAFVEANGRVPRMTELEDGYFIYKYYRTFFEFIRAYGYEKLYLRTYGKNSKKSSSTTMEDRFTKIALVDKLSTFVKKNGRTPTLAEFGHTNLIYKYYGSYFEFIRASGYEDLYLDSQTPKKKNPSVVEFEKSFARTILINRFHSFVEEQDRVPSATELGHFDQVKEYFGSYNEFVRSQGFSSDSLENDKHLTKNDLARKLKTFILINEHVPNSLEFGYEEQIKNLFGTFDSFLRENGQEPFQTKN